MKRRNYLKEELEGIKPKKHRHKSQLHFCQQIVCTHFPGCNRGTFIICECGKLKP